jgi:hypothetical protein
VEGRVESEGVVEVLGAELLGGVELGGGDGVVTLGLVE